MPGFSSNTQSLQKGSGYNGSNGLGSSSMGASSGGATPLKFFELFQTRNDQIVASSDNWLNDFDFVNLSAVEGICPPDLGEIVEAWVWIVNTAHTATPETFSLQIEKGTEGGPLFSNSSSVEQNIGNANSRWKIDITENVQNESFEASQTMGVRVSNGGGTFWIDGGGVLHQ